MTRVVLCLDPGRVRIGVAVSDELGLVAHARPFVDATPHKAALIAIAALARDTGASRVVIGLPLELSGHAGVAAQRAVRFAQTVADATGLDVELCDERWTTVEATRRQREVGSPDRRRIDSASASVLLQAWLDRRPRGAK